MTVKACCNIMANLILEKRVAIIQPVLLDCIQIIGVFYANQEIDLLLLLLSSLSDIVSARQMPPEAMLEALKSCVQVGPGRRNEGQIMNDPKQINAVRNAAGTFILYCIEHFTETLLKHGLVAPLIELTMRFMSDGVLEVASSLMTDV